MNRQSRENTSLKNLASGILENKEKADAFLESHVRGYVARQIKAMRKAKEWTQADLANACHAEQSNISRLENPKYGSFTINTLLEVAKAFDVGLSVRFVPFSELIQREYRPHYTVSDRTQDQDLIRFSSGRMKLSHDLIDLDPPDGGTTVENGKLSYVHSEGDTQQ